MPTLIREKAEDYANEIAKVINEHCGAPVLSKFDTNYRQLNILESRVDMVDTVSLDITESFRGLILKRTIKAHERMITALQATKEKLEDLQKQLN